MSKSFEIVLSKPLTPDDFAVALASLMPPNLRINIRLDLTDLPNEPGAILAIVRSTDDLVWPCILDVLVYRDECGLQPYPDLRIAASLWEWFGANSLCGTYPFVGELDPHNPYWFLACISGQWYLADTFGTQLMGPYTDERHEFLSEEVIQLVRPVIVPQ